MSNLDKVVLQLRKERDEEQKRVEQLDQALAALGNVDVLRTGPEVFSTTAGNGHLCQPPHARESPPRNGRVG